MFGQDDILTTDEWALTQTAETLQPAVEEYPSEARYIPIYEQQAAAIDASVAAEAPGSSIFDFLKSAITTLSPVATSIIKATSKTPTTVVPATGVTATGLPVSSAGLFSSPLLLIGAAVGGFLFLRGRRKKGRK